MRTVYVVVGTPNYAHEATSCGVFANENEAWRCARIHEDKYGYDNCTVVEELLYEEYEYEE